MRQFDASQQIGVAHHPMYQPTRMLSSMAADGAAVRAPNAVALRRVDYVNQAGITTSYITGAMDLAGCRRYRAAVDRSMTTLRSRC